MKSFRTIQCYLSGVKKLHIILNHSTRGFCGYALQLTLMGIRRMSTYVVKQAKPITPAILERIHAQLNHNDPQDAVFWCACIMSFFLLLRKSNLVPDTRIGFDAHKQLQRSDLLYTGHNIIVGLRWLKNEQFARDLMTFPLPVLPGSVLCPLDALYNVFKLIPAPVSAHLFQLPDGSSLTYRKYQNRLRGVLVQAGVEDPNGYSSHSFRRGGASFAFLCGVPAEIIKVLGHWKSSCYMKYLYFPLEARIAASDLIRTRLMHSSFKY